MGEILSIFLILFQLDQMQLGLPSRDYYLKQSSEGDLEAYHKYMTNVAVLLGANKSTAKEELKLVVEFERQLANVSFLINLSYFHNL